jgi:hypothetical protein
VALAMLILMTSVANVLQILEALAAEPGIGEMMDGTPQMPAAALADAAGALDHSRAVQPPLARGEIGLILFAGHVAFSSSGALSSGAARRRKIETSLNR